jgi:hypothetical protein
MLVKIAFTRNICRIGLVFIDVWLLLIASCINMLLSITTQSFLTAPASVIVGPVIIRCCIIWLSISHIRSCFLHFAPIRFFLLFFLISCFRVLCTSSVIILTSYFTIRQVLKLFVNI